MNSHTKLHSNMYAQPSVMHPSFCATAVFASLIGISAMIVFTLMRAAGALSLSLSVTRNISRRSNKRTRHSQLLSRLTTARQDEVKTLSATLNRSGLQLFQVATGFYFSSLFCAHPCRPHAVVCPRGFWHWLPPGCQMLTLLPQT